jgi:hypothetical protein
MKRSEINAAIARAIGNAKKFAVALPKWADWSPARFTDASTDGIRHQQLGWKVVDFGAGDFANCGLVVLAVCSPMIDAAGEPQNKPVQVGTRTYPATAFSRKFLFVQAGQTEPHHFHRQKERKEVTVLAGAPVRFELAWADGDTALSDKAVEVQVDGIWHSMPAGDSIVIQPGETITLPGELSHIISVAGDGLDTIMVETCTANNNNTDNIFPFMTPTSQPVDEDAERLYQQLDEHSVAAKH